MNLVFLKVPSSVPLPSTISAESVLFEEDGKECFFINLVVRRHIVMVQQRTEEIPLSLNGTLGSRPPNYFPVLQALLLGNGSKSHPLSSAEGCTRHYLAFQNSSQFWTRAIVSLFGKKYRPSGVKTKPNPGQ